jgi:hypothetical protein
MIGDTLAIPLYGKGGVRDYALVDADLYRAIKVRPWQAVGYLRGREYSLGYYETVEEAAAVSAAWRRDNLPFSRAAATETLRTAA